MHRIQPVYLMKFSRLIATDIFRICSEIFFDFYSGYLLINLHCLIFIIIIAKLWQEEFVFKIVVILNAGVCIVSGLVVFSVFLEKLRIMFM